MNPGVLNPRAVFPPKFQPLSREKSPRRTALLNYIVPYHRIPTFTNPRYIVKISSKAILPRKEWIDLILRQPIEDAISEGVT